VSMDDGVGIWPTYFGSAALVAGLKIAQFVL
jgi:hypothetical protein